MVSRINPMLALAAAMVTVLSLLLGSPATSAVPSSAQPLDAASATKPPGTEAPTVIPTEVPTEDPGDDDAGDPGLETPELGPTDSPDATHEASPEATQDDGPSPTPPGTVAPSGSPGESSGPAPAPSARVTPTPDHQPASAEPKTAQVVGGWFQYDMDQVTMEGRLYVGMLDGPTHKVLSTDGVGIHASGPVDGLVIADWREGDRYTIAVFDTTSGERDTLRASESPVGGATLAADGSGYYWYEGEFGGPFELWFERLDGTGGQRLVAGIGSTAPVLRQSLDGAWLVSYDWWLDDDPYTVVDVERGDSWQLTATVANEVLGVLVARSSPMAPLATSGRSRSWPWTAVCGGAGHRRGQRVLRVRIWAP